MVEYILYIIEYIISSSVLKLCHSWEFLEKVKNADSRAHPFRFSFIWDQKSDCSPNPELIHGSIFRIHWEALLSNIWRESHLLTCNLLFFISKEHMCWFLLFRHGPCKHSSSCTYHFLPKCHFYIFSFNYQ